MGRSKALLLCVSNETFVCRIARTLRTAGAHEVFVIGRPDDVPLRDEVARCYARFIGNPRADEGQLSSLQAGIDALDTRDLDGTIVMPVDMPLVSSETIEQVIAAFLIQRPPVARAVYRGRHGHPVLFSPRVFDDLRRADPRIGAKAVVHAHANAIVDVEVDDAAVLRDVDTPEDYRQLFA
jgi:molybdenum cofactor cytidylyltransferase